MAIYVLKGTIGGKPFLSYLVTTKNHISNFYTTAYKTYAELAEEVDSKLIEMGAYFPWESCRYPVQSDIFSDNTNLKSHYVGMYSGDVSVGDSVIINGINVGSIEYVQNNVGYRIKASVLYFQPNIGMLYQRGASNASERYGPVVIFGPEDCVIDGKFFLRNKTLTWAQFQLGYSRNSETFSFQVLNVNYNNVNTSPLDGTDAEIYVPDIPPNPFEPVGPSAPTNPDQPPGTFDDTSDPIPDSPLPTLSAANTGFTRIYNPSLSQVQQLAQYLWTTPDVIQTIWNHIKQFFEDPMQAIIGFNLVPVPVPNGKTTTFKLMFIDTGVSMTAAANQFVDQDCGTVKLERYYGSALDQSPHTKVSCFLPYIGTVQLNTDEVMGTTLQVKYRVDIVSGSCVAKIFVDGNCLYQYSGHCAINVPISSADFSSYVSAAIGVASTAIGLAAGGAAGAIGAAIAPEAAQQTNQAVPTTQTTQQVRNPASGRMITAGRTTTVETREAPGDQNSTQASFGGITPANIANTVGEIMGSKPHIAHSGAFSGNSGYLGVRRPFLIIERPNLCMPANFQRFNGFPAMITVELSTCKGFTRVQQVQLTGMTATNPEQAEILELLKSGVVF